MNAVNPLLHTRSLEGIVNSLVTCFLVSQDGLLVKSITRGALSSSSIRTCRVKYPTRERGLQGERNLLGHLLLGGSR